MSRAAPGRAVKMVDFVLMGGIKRQGKNTLTGKKTVLAVVRYLIILKPMIRSSQRRWGLAYCVSVECEPIKSWVA